MSMQCLHRRDCRISNKGCRIGRFGTVIPFDPGSAGVEFPEQYTIARFTALAQNLLASLRSQCLDTIPPSFLRLMFTWDAMQNNHQRRNSISFALILGTNEIASAVAVHLYRAGYSVVLSHDPFPPVFRRKMSFHDALFDDQASLDGVIAQRIDTGVEILTCWKNQNVIVVTELGLLDLIIIQKPSLLIDARMQKYQVTPDLRRLANVTIGLGPSFIAGENCDYAIETHPRKAGRILSKGGTDKATGVPPKLGRRGAERFVISEMPGRWYTPLEIGSRIFKDYTVGFLGDKPIDAPFDGILRGLVRDGTEVPAGVKLLEIDPRGRNASWTGIESKARIIALAVVQTITHHKQDKPATAPAKPKASLNVVK